MVHKAIRKAQQDLLIWKNECARFRPFEYVPERIVTEFEKQAAPTGLTEIAFLNFERDEKKNSEKERNAKL